MEAHPELYLGPSGEEGVGQQQKLELFISGFGIALRHHGIADQDLDVYAGFGAYLRDRFDAGLEDSPICVILGSPETKDDAWNAFWRLFREYRAGAPPIREDATGVG